MTTRPRYLPLTAVADEYGISIKTLRRRIADGTLPGYRISGRVRVREDEVDRMVRRIPAATR